MKKCVNATVVRAPLPRCQTPIIPKGMTSYSRELSHFEFLFLAFLYFRQTKTSHPWARNTDHRPRWSVWTTRTRSERAEVTWSASTLLHLLILFEQHTWIEHVLSFLFFSSSSCLVIKQRCVASVVSPWRSLSPPSRPWTGRTTKVVSSVGPVTSLWLENSTTTRPGSHCVTTATRYDARRILHLQ